MKRLTIGVIYKIIRMGRFTLDRIGQMTLIILAALIVLRLREILENPQGETSRLEKRSLGDIEIFWL